MEGNWHPSAGELVRVSPSEPGRHDGFTAKVVSVSGDTVKVIELRRSRHRFIRLTRIGRLTGAQLRRAKGGVLR